VTSRVLDGRAALVTGASRGIGTAMAERLASLGAHVAVGYQHNREQAHEVARSLSVHGTKAVAVAVDVRDSTSVDDAFSEVESVFGQVDVLVNNAGVHRGGRVHRLPLDDWDEVLATNLTGAFLCTRRAVPAMKESGWGRIVNVSSVIGIKGHAGDAAYAASKAGLLGMTRALAVELAASGTTVNALAPGFVVTDMTRGLSDAAQAGIDASVPVGRQARPEELGDALQLLVCSDYTTGTTVVVDGGWTVS
jgi:3-oxoacyl-[acyl-carrier protein] reductase